MAFLMLFNWWLWYKIRYYSLSLYALKMSRVHSMSKSYYIYIYIYIYYRITAVVHRNSIIYAITVFDIIICDDRKQWKIAVLMPICVTSVVVKLSQLSSYNQTKTHTKAIV